MYVSSKSQLISLQSSEPADMASTKEIKLVVLTSNLQILEVPGKCFGSPNFLYILCVQ